MTEREFTTTGALEIEESIDLEACDTDPIHQTALIQPFGVFIRFEPDSGAVVSCSGNVEQRLDQSIDDVLNQTVFDILAETDHSTVRDYLDRRSDVSPPYRFCLDGSSEMGYLFPLEDSVGLELEPISDSGSNLSGQFLGWDNKLDQLHTHGSMSALYQAIVSVVKEWSGLDRVMLYEFNEDGHGTVEAEEKEPDMGPYLGQQFPRSDIPDPARRIYRLTDYRYIPNVDYDPVPIVNADGEIPRDRIDLTYSTLRNVPLIHRKYLENMNVGASFSVPLKVDGALHGLIACHNREPLDIHWEDRLFCSRVGKVASMEIEKQIKKARQEKRSETKLLRDEFLSSSEGVNQLFKALKTNGNKILDALDSNAFYVRFDDDDLWVTAEDLDAPSPSLLEWINSHLDRDTTIFSAESLVSEFGSEWDRSEELSGCLATRIIVDSDNFCVWFRPEQQETIEWGGDPREPVIVDDSGELNPRRSFEEWTQVIRGQCRRWTELDETAAEDFVTAFNQIALKGTVATIEEYNQQLEDQNTELLEIREQLETANEQKDQLMDELHHRVKNNYQLMSSLVNLHKNEVDNEQAINLLGDLRDRFLTMSSLHELLTEQRDSESIDLSEYLSELQAKIMSGSSFPESDLTVELDMDEFRTSFDHAKRVGLVFNELLTNSLQHGVGDGAGDRIRVSLEVDGDESLTLTVSDNGPGFEQTFEEMASDSLGLSIAQNIVTGQLNGTLEADGSDGGTFKVKFHVPGAS